MKFITALYSTMEGLKQKKFGKKIGASHFIFHYGGIKTVCIVSLGSNDITLYSTMEGLKQSETGVGDSSPYTLYSTMEGLKHSSFESFISSLAFIFHYGGIKTRSLIQLERMLRFIFHYGGIKTK